MKKESSEEKPVIKARWEILIDPELKKWLKVACIEKGITGSQFLENVVRLAQVITTKDTDDIDPRYRLTKEILVKEIFKGESK